MKHRILIVDDEEAIVFAMHDYFERVGFEVDSACKKDQALSLLQTRGCYSVAVIDLQLTTCAPAEGLELLALVKQLCPATRTMILTAYASPEARIQVQRLGADALLQKSQSLGQVLDVVRSLLGPEHGVERKH